MSRGVQFLRDNLWSGVVMSKTMRSWLVLRIAMFPLNDSKFDGVRLCACLG